MFSLSKHILIVAFASVLSIYVSFGLWHIGQFVTADEHYWIYERIPQYWNAIEKGKWHKTYINDKPGISLALISGIGLLQFPDPETHQVAGKDSDETLFQAHISEDLYTSFRLPILWFNALLLILIYWLAQKILPAKTALFFAIFTATSPILIGISQIINPDSLLWSFSIAATLSFFAFLKRQKIGYALLAGALLALCLLTKYAANILLPFFLLAWISYPLFVFRGEVLVRQLPIYFRTTLLGLLAAAFSGALTLAILLPALFVKSVYAYRLILGQPYMPVMWSILVGSFILFSIDTWLLHNRIIRTVFSRLTQAPIILARITSAILLLATLALLIGRNFFSWSIFERVPFNLKNLGSIRTEHLPWDIPLLQFNPLVFSLTPVVLLLVIFLWTSLFIRKDISRRLLFLIFLTNTFFLIFCIAAILSKTLVTIRYGIMLYPFFALLAAIGLQGLLEALTRFSPTRILTTPLVLGIIVASSVASLLSIQPFFFNYSNFFLPEKAVITDGWGYGGFEAAQHLNQFPDAEHLTVWSDYFGFCEFFHGVCLTDYDIALDKKIDFFVLSRRGKERYFQAHRKWEQRPGGIKIQHLYNDPSIPREWTMSLDGKESNSVSIIAAPAPPSE